MATVETNTTRLSYAFHTIRHVRNVGTHRCLRLFRETGGAHGIQCRRSARRAPGQ
jgi:hypothetical protein